MKRLILILAALLVPFACLAQRGSAEIKDVKVSTEGPGSSDESFVRAHVTGEKGEDLDPMRVSKDVRGLLDTGQFTDVQANAEKVDDGLVLTYLVRRKLRMVDDIKVEGSDHFSERKIRKYLDIDPGDLVDDAVLAVHAQSVLEEYRLDGYSDTTVDWEIAVLDEEAGTAVVTVKIVEGVETEIEDVSFIGNTNLSSRTLKSSMNVAAWWHPGGWFGSGGLDEANLLMGSENLKRKYLAEGYLEAEIGQPEWKEDEPGKFRLIYPVHEGPMYVLGDTILEGASLFPESELLRGVAIDPGDAISMKAVAFSTENLRSYYTSRGYRRTSVRYALSAEPGDVDENGNPKANLVFSVREGSLVHVRNIFVRGNTVTRDDVIRRELSIYPGDKFDERAVRSSENRLRNLGFFSRVMTRPESTPKLSENDLVFEVQEQRTGQFMVGGGFSSVDKFVGMIELKEGNFDISSWPPKGAGQKLKLRAQFGSTTSLAELSFVEPWLFGRKLALGLDLYVNERDYDDYDEKKIGAGISLGRALSTPFFTKMNVRYDIIDVEITGITDTNMYMTVEDTPEPFHFEYGSELKSRATLILTRDVRDSYFFPTRGNRVVLTAHYAGGVLGGDSEVFGWWVKGEQYFPMWLGHVLGFRTKFEIVDSHGTSEVPLSDRLFVGGGRSVRGFDYRGVGPKVSRDIPIQDENGDDTDKSVEVYRMKGGQTLAIAGMEYIVPLVDKINVAAFIDAGGVWEDPYEVDFDRVASSAGFELRFDMPQFPIKLSYAWTLSKDDEETDEKKWGFWIGSGF